MIRRYRRLPLFLEKIKLSQKGIPMKSYNLLIADDEPLIRSIIERVGLELGWSVDLASNGEEALMRLQERPHQVFILDVKMPGPSGIELARKIMEREEAPAISHSDGLRRIGSGGRSG